MTEAFICDAIPTPIGRYGGRVESMTRAPFIAGKKPMARLGLALAVERL
jgi:hypothetical protein